MTKELFRSLMIEAIQQQDMDKIDQLSEFLFGQYEKNSILDNRLHDHEITLRELIVEVRKGFEMMDKRFEAVDKRFEAVDKRFEDVYKRFEAVDKRFEAVDKRFDDLIHMMDKRFEAVDKRFEDMRHYMDKRFNFQTWLIAIGLAATNILIALLKIL